MSNELFKCPTCDKVFEKPTSHNCFEYKHFDSVKWQQVSPLPSQPKEFQDREPFDKFEVGVESLINKNSLENASDTPDYISAEFIRKVFELFNKAINERTRWYAPDKQSLSSSLNEKKEQAQEKDWEVMAVKKNTNGTIFNLDVDGEDKWIHGMTPEWMLSQHVPKYYSIHSVRRNSDGCVFSVGDELVGLGYYQNKTHAIKSIYPKNGTIAFEYGNEGAIIVIEAAKKKKN